MQSVSAVWLTMRQGDARASLASFVRASPCDWRDGRSLAARRNEGRVVTNEKDPGRASWAEAYFRQADMAGTVAVRRGDALVYLCWKLDEPTVAYWHPVETGFSGRQPL